MPAILLHPYIGALLWVVFGLMNPHRLTFGPAFDFPFAMVIAIATFVGIAFTRDHRRLKLGGAAGVLLGLLLLWVTVTTVFALTPEQANPIWSRVAKIFLMTFVLTSVLHTRRHVELLILAIVFSIGFYGVKGGIFTILTGGQGMVNGPEDSVIMGNNSLGVANVMIIPLFGHYYQQTRKMWLRGILVACMLLCAAATLGSYSRGALLALFAMGAILWLRSSHKVVTMALLLVTALVLIPFMPERWTDRMYTIETYQQEGSAMGRIYAWRTAWNIATDRLVGGGFDYPTLEVMQRYSPTPNDVKVAHSIYFQVLGEHGFVGLALFLVFWIIVWRQCASVRRQARRQPGFEWAYSLMSMIQASLVGYAVGGAFLNLAFWDMPYYLWGAIVVTQYVMKSAAATLPSDEVGAGRRTRPVPKTIGTLPRPRSYAEQ
jgi:probable O-glycosylation ligase (exosortase A-associated)